MIGTLVRQIAALKAAAGAGEGADARSFIIVSSGAIALGLNRMKLSIRPKEINLLQAAAAMGQSRLMHAYEREFEAVHMETAQILLTYEDIRSRTRYLNIRNTIFTLWGFGVVPIVNENDSVSVQELVGAFGDNDELSALLARAVKADWLVLLTDVDGFFVPNGGRPRLMRTIRKLTPEMEDLCNGKSRLGRGGMRSKLRAAKLASESGVHVAIVNGSHGHAIPWAMERKIGTYFPPQKVKS
jgi:glutamate 5-kinase